MAQPKNKTRKALSDVLFLYTTKAEDPVSFTYEIECTALKAVKFTLNFTGSENFRVEGKNDMILSATVRPFHRCELGKICLVNEDKRASLKMGCEWLMEEPQEGETEEYLQAHRVLMANILKDAETLCFPLPLDDPTNKIVQDTCGSYSKSFVDLSFPPTDEALYKNSSLVKKGEASATKGKKAPVEWKRPVNFMDGEFFVFHDGIDPADIRQGALGDCWFLCAIAALTEFPELVERLFPEHEVNTAGVYNVKFCKNGMWQTVRVDDYFPCYPGGGPLYSRSNGNELWVLLLEKAYAKLHGSYEAIKSGWAYEGMMDLTGAPYKTVRLDDAELKPKIANGELWKELLHYDLENYIMSASTPGEDVYTETGARPGKNGTGLVAGHAYTLISVKETSKGDKLCKLRNPWGSMEWNGDWSDTSPLWTEELKAEMNVTVSDDGSFWMSFKDMLAHFYSVNVCMVRHAGLNDKPWKECRRKFHYDYDSNESTPDTHTLTCPSYIMHVTKPGTFIVSVHQEDIRCATSKPYIDVGVSVLKANPVYGTFTLMNGTGNSVERQNQTNEFELPVGKYVIVPTSTGCKLKQYFDKYLSHKDDNKVNTTAAAAEEKVALVTKNDKGEVVFTKAVYRVYEELFTRMDMDGDGYLSKVELDQYMIRTEGSAIEEKAYMWLLHNFESREKRGLTLAGFIRAQLFVFKHTGSDEERLRNEFKILGYDDSLQFESGRAAVVAVHSTGDFSLESAPFDHGAFKEAVELPVIQQGECISFEEGQISMYKYRSGYHGLSFVVENKHPTAPLVFVLDCSESVNVISHRDTLSHQETIPPNQRRVMHHLMPADSDTSGWSWAYSASYMWEDDV